MEASKMNAYRLAVFMCLVVLATAGIGAVYLYHPAEDTHRKSPDSTEDPGSVCSPGAAAPRVPVPVDTSVPVQDPMPGIRYFIKESESGRTIVLNKGDVFEIDLGFAPGLAMRWTVLLTGCGLELVNDGTYYTGGDFWNNTGYYRARYRAVSPGTSKLGGKLVLKPDEAGDPRFNLTVVVT